LNIIMLT